MGRSSGGGGRTAGGGSGSIRSFTDSAGRTFFEAPGGRTFTSAAAARRFVQAGNTGRRLADTPAANLGTQRTRRANRRDIEAQANANRQRRV